jgi:16S rRNA (cytosine1402-N4)-methyltransferase
MQEFKHAPVLLDEICDLARDKSRAVDCTVGGGGHAAAFEKMGLDVLGIDRDADALETARTRLRDTTELVHGAFASAETLETIEAFQPDFILMDLGVSSWQLDSDDRGFSFREKVKLDMRMDERGGLDAADVLNTYSDVDLARVFREYGDERKARALARQVCRRRERAPFQTADDLVAAIRGTLGPRSGPPEFARLFQAVRIEVNGELDELSDSLPSLFEALVPGGILAVISYHSGEDRIVKHLFVEWSSHCICPPEMPLCMCRGKPLGERINRKPINASAEESAINPRARSAKLRVFRKSDK